MAYHCRYFRGKWRWCDWLVLHCADGEGQKRWSGDSTWLRRGWVVNALTSTTPRLNPAVAEINIMTTYTQQLVRHSPYACFSNSLVESCSLSTPLPFFVSGSSFTMASVAYSSIYLHSSQFTGDRTSGHMHTLTHAAPGSFSG
jgi:hypothetical protein